MIHRVNINLSYIKSYLLQESKGNLLELPLVEITIPTILFKKLGAKQTTNKGTGKNKQTEIIRESLHFSSKDDF